MGGNVGKPKAGRPKGAAQHYGLQMNGSEGNAQFLLSDARAKSRAGSGDNSSACFMSFFDDFKNRTHDWQNEMSRKR